MSTWWKLTVQANDVETLALLALDHGACGSQIIGDRIAVVYLEGDKDSAERIRYFLSQEGAEKVQLDNEPEVNWVARCQELWSPIIQGRLRIIPVLEPGSNRIQPHPPGENNLTDIYITPNMAFGTGHHESTQQVLELLQDDRLAAPSPRAILDVGTGTGILAFAAASLFPDSDVIGLDVDPQSIEKAKENKQLNARCQRVQLLSGTFDSKFGVFDLITANIYAEILIAYQRSFTKHLSPQGFLILAGILDELVGKLESSYATNFTTLEKLHRGEWVAYLLKKK